ncbi:MAG: YihY/virulence factor BrkB family protein [Thermoleophilia bacterium]|nr:YihY/virulence factor BrkB family protein [Thermoleophilia bacterium]
MDEAPTARSSDPWLLRVVRSPLRLVRTLFRVIPQAIDGYFADRCGQHAAGIAYRVLFSLVPLSIILVAIFGIVLRNDSLRNDVITEIVDRFPLTESGGADVTRQIEKLAKLASPATALGLVSLLVFGWAATGMMAALRAGLEVAMRVERGRPPVRGKLVDVILIVGAAALVLVVVFLNLAQAVVFGWIQQPLDALGLDGGLLEQGIRRGAPLLVTTAVVLLLYRFVPARRLRIGDALAGAIVTALLLLAISLVSGMIFERVRSLSVSVVYASLTSALVFLYSVYLAASALLLGAEVAAAWSHPGEPTGDTLRQQVRRVALGLFVYQEPPAHPEPRPRVPTDPAP